MGSSIRRGKRLLVRHYVAQTTVVFADGLLQRQRLLRQVQNLAHALRWNLQLQADLLAARLAAEFLEQLPAYPADFANGVCHVDREAGRSRFVGGGAGEGLA